MYQFEIIYIFQKYCDNLTWTTYSLPHIITIRWIYQPNKNHTFFLKTTINEMLEFAYL